MVTASHFKWAFTNTRPDFPNGGLRLPNRWYGMYQFEPLPPFSACRAATSGDAMDGWLSGPKEIVMELHVNWGHACGATVETGCCGLGWGQHALANLCGRGPGTVRGMPLI